MNPSDLFRRLSAVMERASIPYMLTGSFASTVYGIGRASQDIDLVIAAGEAQVRTLLSLLPQNEFYVEPASALESHRRKSMFNAIDNITGLKVDFIFRKERPFSEEEFRRRKSVDVHGVQLFLVSAEDLIVAKLEWAKMGASLRQIEDVTGILKVRKDELDFAYIDRWVKHLDLTEQWMASRQSAGLE